MADTKITALAAITTVDPAADVLPIVDISDTSMAASGTTKKITSNQILGAGGTATLASATITGAATVGTTLGVTGQLSTANVVKATGNPGLSSAGATEAFVAHNTTYGAVLYGQGTTYDAALLDRNTFLRLTVTTAGAQVSGDLSMTSGNVVMATSGKGIDFSATASGSGTMTSELLNDYEEGTFTPTVVGTTTAGVGVYTSQVGRYTKIGNLVSVQVYLNWSAHTGTGNLRFSGLPFTISSDTSYFSAVTFGYTDISLTASNVLIAYGDTNTTNIEAKQYPVGGGSVADVPIDTAAIVIYALTYKV